MMIEHFTTLQDGIELRPVHHVAPYRMRGGCNYGLAKALKIPAPRLDYYTLGPYKEPLSITSRPPGPVGVEPSDNSFE